LSVVSEVGDRVVPPLPEGWVPDDAIISAFARLEDGRWSVILPAFTVVGVGDTLQSAAHEAGELLVDYLRMCAADGLTFEESRRRIPAGWFARLVLGAVRSSVAYRVRHSARRERVMRLPARNALCF
jgi:hypothetical protein